MIFRNLRRMFAALAMLLVYALTPRQDKRTLLAIALCSQFMRESVD